MNPLVVYYSFSGNTRALAEDIALILDCELRELVPERPYSFSYNTAVKEARHEIERGYCPPLLAGGEGVGEFDPIFSGSPHWLKHMAPPVLSFLRTVDLAGKTIVPFCTHGGGGFGGMLETFTRECPGSTVVEGFAAGAECSFDELEAWLEKLRV